MDQDPVDIHIVVQLVHYIKEPVLGYCVFQSDQGTTHPAVFKDIPAPDLVPNRDCSTPERQIETLRLNFYLENRWCGEALR